MSVPHVALQLGSYPAKENPEFNQTYLQHLNEESEAGGRPTEPRERGPLTAPALGLFHAPLHSVAPTVG